MWILVLLLQFVLCWSEKPIDYTPLLKYLDDDIRRDLIDPIEDCGKTLVDYVSKYNSRLADSRDMIQQNIYEAYVKAVELQKIGGPQFLKVTIDKELLSKVYNWTGDDLSQLDQQFEDTKQIWKDIESEFGPAEARFKAIHEEEAKEKAEQEKREQKRVENLRKAEEEFNKRVTVNIATAKPGN